MTENDGAPGFMAGGIIDRYAKDELCDRSSVGPAARRPAVTFAPIRKARHSPAMRGTL
jgi:hypothetical protein